MQAVTLTLNPCLDRTFWVHDFDEPPFKMEIQTGGKGLNVARVLSALGIECAAVFPCGGETGEQLLRLAKSEGICARPSAMHLPTRVIDTWVRAADFAQKVDYTRGAALEEDELDALESALFQALNGARVLAICGSASCAAAAQRVPGIIRRAREMGVVVLLDSNGPALTEGVKALPDVIKPNQAELASLVGRPLSPGDEADAASELVSRGIGSVLVSLGATGCAYVREDGQHFCPAPKIATVNPVGSGDSFVAGFLYAALMGYPEQTTALAIACAAGAANAAMFPAARIGKAEISALLGYNI